MDVEELRFAKTHEWIEPRGDKRKVGISDFAQEQLGDIVYVEFPDAGKTIAAGDEACLIESCKATASVYSPVGGTIIEYNTALADAPEKINESPYEEGWLFIIEIEHAAVNEELLSHEKYLASREQE